MEKDNARVRVIENIKQAIKENNYNKKVEEGDPVVTDEQRERVILNFDILRKKPWNWMQSTIVRCVVDNITKKINKDTEIVGIENIQNINSGAVITSNHFSKVDSTIIRYLMQKIEKSKKLYIIVQESNMFMKGKLGWLLKNCYTIPISKNFDYTINNLIPALDKIFKSNGFLLVYPEKEMWYNYRRPRAMKIGAYHYACKYDVPVIPCFTEIIDTDCLGQDGFYISKYKLHVLPPIYPDKTKNMRERKEDMMQRDYNARIKKYEEVYSRNYEETFEVERDIAGW